MRYSTGKAKNPLFYKLFIGAASFAFLIHPLFAHANFTSFISSFLEDITQVSKASSSGYNSQTVPLLQPAVNLDPNPAKGGGNISILGGMALYTESGPSGTDAESDITPPSSQISVYTVHPGDTLSQIAQMFDVTTNTIVWANDIQGGIIQPGQQLVILPVTGVRHKVASGDTLASIAKKYKGDADAIASYNGLSRGASLAAGDTIIIPDGKIGVSPTPSSGSHATKISNIAKGKTTEPYLGGSGPAIPGYFIWPVDGGVITQGLHGWNAVDIGAPKGTSIVAAAPGVVIVAKSNGGWNGGYGNYVVIEHQNGTQTLYGHMSGVLVSPGDAVVQGQGIGRVGATGQSTGNHLHFEVRGALNPFVN